MQGIRAQDLRDYVISPTLNYLGLHSPAAEHLLLGTAAVESRMGYYLKQVNGIALGIYQIEPETHHDVWDHYLNYHSGLKKKVKSLAREQYHIEDRMDQYAQELISNLAYSTAIARIIYYRHATPLPEAHDVLSLARYWKLHYNTRLGKGTISGFVDAYQKFVEHH